MDSTGVLVRAFRRPRTRRAWHYHNTKILIKTHTRSLYESSLSQIFLKTRGNVLVSSFTKTNKWAINNYFAPVFLFIFSLNSYVLRISPEEASCNFRSWFLFFLAFNRAFNYFAIHVYVNQINSLVVHFPFVYLALSFHYSSAYSRLRSFATCVAAIGW